MSKEELATKLAAIVAEKQGCKATDLAVEAAIQFRTNFNEFDEALDFAIQTKRIICVNYTLSLQPYREKSFLFPSKTIIKNFTE